MLARLNSLWGMGGAYLIGFLWASVALTGVMKTTAPEQLWLPYLLLSVPILDMVYVIGARICDRKSPFFADRRHLHHRLLDHGFSYDSTVWQSYLLTATTGSLAVAIAANQWRLATPEFVRPDAGGIEWVPTAWIFYPP
jgi:UDP-GlcNAc:undecaprenyl-phosphate GlcNAc-1-phosphate transferase